MRIAVVGTGIAGMTAASLLHPHHDLAVFEADSRIGGHAHTVDVADPAGMISIDTGFIVCNDRTYPNFLKLLARIGVRPQPSDMSFSVRCETTGLEYSGGSWNGLFAQRGNLLRPRFLGMLADILRFNRHSLKLLETDDSGPTLGEYLRTERYGEAFIERYLVPMGAAIWSSAPAQMMAFPARRLVEFFKNHGLLDVFDRPQWLTIPGGSRTYVEKLTAPFRERIRLKSPVLAVRREDEGVVVASPAGEERFDHVILAAHADQSLKMLVDASPAEAEMLLAFPYQENDTVLHRDVSLLPRSKRAWSSWNAHLPKTPADRALVTYWMNRLHRLSARHEYCVTLNRRPAIAPDSVVGSYTYHHPVQTAAAASAQKRWAEINGKNRVSFCGAYWGFGFHEDGVVSGVRVAEPLGGTL
jgi:predicted NAD/FAD-binding protein